MPPLHDGGVHDAVTVAPPPAAPETVPMLPNTVVALFAETGAAIGFDVFQLSGAPVSVFPATSVTVAFKVALVPVPSWNEVLLGLFESLTVMLCTGQV